MIQKWKVTIPELSGTQERSVYLYLPESYQTHFERRYPVLYMFDGHNVFFDRDATYGKSWGMKEYMDRTDTQLIIVAVECNHSPDHGRLKEYAPFSFRERGLGTIPGLGKLTMEWMVNTLKRDIDHRFRTLDDRDHTYIAGSSMGGLMSLYALIEYNHIFSGAAALSPSLWTAPGHLENLIRRQSLLPNTVLYMDYGENELARHKGMPRYFSRIAALLMEKQILVGCRIVPGGEHCEASWEKQIPFFMRTLLYERH